MSGKFCVVITTSSDNPEKATIGFVTANAAVAAGKETMVFLNFEGARLCQKGFASPFVDSESGPLEKLMETFVANGGKITVCLRCFNKRKLDKNALIPGAVIAGAPKLVEFLTDGTPCVTF